MKYWIQNLIVKLFGLEDITNYCLAGKEEQKKEDDRKWSLDKDHCLKAQRDDYEHQLQLKDAVIEMQLRAIKQLEDHQRHVANLEYSSKRNIKENFINSTALMERLNHFRDGIIKDVADVQYVVDDIVKLNSSVLKLERRKK